MQPTHQKITNYIDQAVEKSFKKYAKRAEQHMTDLKTFFSLELGKVLEAVNSRPTEERVREIVHEEMKPTKVELELVKKEVSAINAKLSRK